jgi:hypothetical protein
MQIVFAFAILEATGTGFHPTSMVSLKFFGTFSSDRSALDPQEVRLKDGKMKLSEHASLIYLMAIGVSMIRTIWKGASMPVHHCMADLTKYITIFLTIRMNLNTRDTVYSF